jgi:uncharacterized protein YggU (UPF0235/DUF167 family)
VRLAVKVVPGSSRNALAGWLGDTLKVRVTAPPERGKANAAVEALIAGALQLPADRVRIVAGAANARKVLEVTGLDEPEVRRRLSEGASNAR